MMNVNFARPMIFAAASLISEATFADFNINMGSSVEFGNGGNLSDSISEESFLGTCSCVKVSGDECSLALSESDTCYQLRPHVTDQDGDYVLGAALKEFEFETVGNNRNLSEMKALRACRQERRRNEACASR